MNRLFSQALVALAVATAALGADLRYQDRGGNRKEGIMDETLVAGAQFELVGLQALRPLSPTAPDLVLLVPPGADEDLAPPEVLQYCRGARRYRMTPAPGAFAVGRPFRWPRSEVIAPGLVPLEELRVLAPSRDGEVFYPVQLSDTDQWRPSAYRFSFWSTGSAELTWTVRATDGHVVAQGDSTGLGGLIDVDWRPQNGETPPAGRYRLEVLANIRTRTSGLQVPREITFVAP